MMFDELLRHLGISLIAFIIGMNFYIMYKVHNSKKIVVHQKVASFKRMTFALEWMLLNQTILFSIAGMTTMYRHLVHAAVTLLDWSVIPLYISTILFNVYLIKHYVLGALNGKLFSKEEIRKLHLTDRDGHP